MFGAACFLPVELTIKRAGAVELAEPEQVRPEVPGFVEEVLVKEGDQVVPRAGAGAAERAGLSATSRRDGGPFPCRRSGGAARLGMDKPGELKQAESRARGLRGQAREASAMWSTSHSRAHSTGTVLTRDLHLRLGTC